MATRFDSLGARVDPRLRERERTDPVELDVHALLRRQDLLPVQVQAPSSVPRQLPIRAMGTAMVAWLGLVFATCYVALPLAMAFVGLKDRKSVV